MERKRGDNVLELCGKVMRWAIGRRSKVGGRSLTLWLVLGLEMVGG